MIRFASFALALALVPAAASATTWSFGDEPKHVVVTFESRMEVEDILGTTRSVRGSATLDDKSQGRFELTVPVDSLRTGIDMRDQHLQSDMWLDAKRFPAIRFEGTTFKKVSNTAWDVSGTFSMHGVKKPLTVRVDVRHIAQADAAKLGLGDAAFVRLRAKFDVKLSDYGVKVPDMVTAKVNDTWTINVSLFGKAAN